MSKNLKGLNKMKIKVGEWLALPIEKRLVLIGNAIIKGITLRQK